MFAEELRRGVALFNTGHYFECHDVLEDLWRGTRGADRLFLQGLIQLAVGLYHAGNGNWRGANSQLRKSTAKLEQYRPAFRGVDVDRLLADSIPWISRTEPGSPWTENREENLVRPKIQYFHLESSKEN
ncbi:MAG TPA: DUF309 domain-containing protein [Bacteroidota bacterium]|nr:DUF309 domain-containing protein [Bacteroidota bacterium]